MNVADLPWPARDNQIKWLTKSGDVVVVFGFGSVLPRIHTDTKNTYPFFSLLGEKGMFLFFWLFAAFLFFNVVAFFGRFRAEFCGPRSVHGAFQFLAVGPSTSFRSQGTPSPIGPLQPDLSNRTISCIK